MKPFEKSLPLVSLRAIAIASAILFCSFGALRSGASSSDGQSPAACNNLGTKLKVASQFAAGRLPRAIAAGDLNKDGFLDLVVANVSPSSERQLSIMLGDGQGQFAVVRNLRLPYSGNALFSIPNALALSDLNGDGWPDIVFASGSGGVALLLSKGDGGFLEPGELAPESQANAVVIADFTGDGKPDIAASGNNGLVSLLRGNGNGTFGAPTSFSVGSFTSTMGGADLNGDGKPDLIVFAGLASGAYLNDGAGGFTKGPPLDASVSGSVAFTLGDFNSDGKQDLISGGFSGASLRLGDGLGAFGTASNLNAPAVSYAAADLNQDSRLDLIATGDNVVVFLGEAAGLGARTQYAAGRVAVSVAVADFNRDGMPDAAVVDQSGENFSSGEASGGVFFLAGEAGGKLRAPTPVVLRDTLNSIKVADLNNDGRSDLLTTAGSSGAVNVALSSPDGFGPPQTYGATFSSRDYRSTAWADFNRDGLLDLAALSSNSIPPSTGQATGIVTIFPGTGPGVFNRDRGVDFNIGNNPESLIAADFNRDGFVDLASANLGSNDISILFNNGRNGFGMETKIPVGLEPRSIATADFDGDGNADLAVANRNSATVSTLLGDGRGGFIHRLVFIGANPRSLAIADLNGDAKPDLIVPNNNRGAASTALNLGAGNFSSPIHSALGLIPFDAAIADFTGDGKPDLAISGTSNTLNPNERVSIFAGDGAGKFAGAEHYRFPAASQLAAGDFNGDALPDLAVIGRANVWIVLNACRSGSEKTLANASAASFRGLVFAPEMIISAFGVGFTAQPISSSSSPPPTELGGVRVNVKDALGVERLAPLFFAGPEQVNYLIPASVGGGSAVVTVTGADQRSVSEFILLSSTSPGLFTANADGQGVPAAAILRIKYPSGAQVFEPVAQYDAGAGKFVPLPIDFGPSIGLEPFADQLFLILFGTGFRSVGALSDATAMVGNQSAMVSYAGPQGELIGLDQLNLRLSRGLRGAGEVDVAVIVDGKPANVVRVAFR